MTDGRRVVAQLALHECKQVFLFVVSDNVENAIAYSNFPCRVAEITCNSLRHARFILEGVFSASFRRYFQSHPVIPLAPIAFRAGLPHGPKPINKKAMYTPNSKNAIDKLPLLA